MFILASKSFDHKDIGVRDATKAVVLMLMMVSFIFVMVY